MSIVSSAVIEDAAQRDGRRAVRERHTDQLGVTYDVVYLAEAGANVSAALAGRAAQLETDLAARELDANEQAAFAQVAPTFSYSTVAAFRARLRSRFQTLAGWDAVRLGKFINSLALTDAQLAAVFGVANPSAALTAIKSRLATLASHYDTVQTDAGQ